MSAVDRRTWAASLIAFASWFIGTMLAFDAPERAAGPLRFLVPGLVLAWIAWRLPDAPSAKPARIARIGANLLLISAVAYAAQGLFAFDPADPDAFASRMRALAWTLWWIAFAPGALLQAVPRGRGFLAASVAAVALVCAPALLPLPRAAMPSAQVVATLAWFGWWFAAAPRPAVSRGAA